MTDGMPGREAKRLLALGQVVLDDRARARVL